MKELTCIVCPVGCTLLVKGESDGAVLDITGNRCRRGAVYAEEEIRSPKRVVTATCAIDGTSCGAAEPDSLNSLNRVPVKTSVPCPKEKINLLLADIYRVKIKLPVKTGDVVIANWDRQSCGGIDVVVTRSIA